MLTVLVMGLITWFVGKPLIRFIENPDGFRAWVDGHGIWGRVLYVGMVIFQVLVALIPGEPLEIAGGYAFGAWEGRCCACWGRPWAAPWSFCWSGAGASGFWSCTFPGRKSSL